MVVFVIAGGLHGAVHCGQKGPQPCGPNAAGRGRYCGSRQQGGCPELLLLETFFREERSKQYHVVCLGASGSISCILFNVSLMFFFALSHNIIIVITFLGHCRKVVRRCSLRPKMAMTVWSKRCWRRAPLWITPTRWVF